MSHKAALPAQAEFPCTRCQSPKSKCRERGATSSSYDSAAIRISILKLCSSMDARLSLAHVQNCLAAASSRHPLVFPDLFKKDSNLVNRSQQNDHIFKAAGFHRRFSHPYHAARRDSDFLTQFSSSRAAQQLRHEWTPAQLHRCRCSQSVSIVLLLHRRPRRPHAHA